MNLSAEEVAAEVADMKEQVPFLGKLVEDAESRWRAQRQASEAVYGPDQRWWPASSVHTLQVLENAVDTLRAKLTEAQAYLAELLAQTET